MADPAGPDVKKKSISAAEQDRPDVAARRQVWHQNLRRIPRRKLVFLDESAARTNMTRTHGRAPRGKRVVDRISNEHWRTHTMISAIRTTGPIAAAALPGATDSDAFLAYVQKVLCPELLPGDVVILDNLPPHHASGVRESVERVGARLLYLPPCSPDFNPIENMWSKVKQHLRSVAARTIRSLHRAITSGLNRVTPSDCIGYFRHCGYFATRKRALL